MRIGPTYHRVFQQLELRPEVRGDLLLLLELPCGPALPIIRDVYDPFGRPFPRIPRIPRDRIYRRLQRIPAGILFVGVAAQTVWDQTGGGSVRGFKGC